MTAHANEVHTHHFERPPRPLPRLGDLARDIGPHYVANGVVGLVFAASGPVAVILSVAQQGGLDEVQIASWIFGIFFFNGLLTVLAAFLYRQPLGFAWTIPGTVLVGPALTHLTWPQVVGAFFGTGLLVLVLGLSGLVRTTMAAIPMPIVMGMVAAVFLRFGTDLVVSVQNDVAIAGPMVLTYLLLTAVPSLGRRLPPVLGALVVGAVAVAVSGQFDLSGTSGSWVAVPQVVVPAFSWAAMAELVVPLAVTVLVVQNGQGVAVLRSAGHRPPVNIVSVMCGVFSLFSAAFGAVSSCLTGPTNALLTHSGERRRHYTAAITFGVLAMGFGLAAPALTRLMLATPESFVLALGGLAMLKVLEAAFVTSFSGRFTLGALVTFIVTVSGVTILGIGSAFWGLVIGYAVSRLLEAGHYDDEG